MKLTFTSLLFTTCVLILNTYNIAAQSTITFTGDRVICNGSGTVITAHAENACSYMWATGEVGSTIIATGAFPHTVTVTDCNGNTSSASITIIDSKMISNLQLDLCKNSTASIIPVNNEGFWTANNPSIATITREGMMMAVDTGKTTFSYHYYNSECVAETKPFEVFPLPEVASAKPSYCLEDVISFTPTQGGTWTTLDNQLASIKNNGEGKPLSPGNPKFIFTSSETGCSRMLENVIIHPQPQVELLGNDTLCLSATGLVKPNSGGLWKGLNSSIGTVTNGGVITAIGVGSTQFQWLETATGCLSELSPVITVIPRPKITSDLPGTICMGGDNISLLAPFEGNWTSSHPTIAKINQEGIIEIVKAGNVTFEIHALDNSCSSQPITFTFQNIKPNISNNVIKQNSFIDLSADAPGTWTSLHENILGIAENKKAISYKAGTTKLEFMADEGCYASFGIKVESGKTGSNADLNPSGFTGSNQDGSRYDTFISESREKNDDHALPFKDVVLSPNPATEVISISETWEHASIHHISGNKVWESQTFVRDIPISSYPAGVYMITFTAGKSTIRKSFIKL